MSGLELSFLDTNKIMSKDVYDQDTNGVTDYAEKITGVDAAPDNTFYGKKAGSIGFHTIEVGSGGAASLNELSDVTITTPAINQVLKYNGSTFVNSAIAYGDISGKPTLSTVATSGSYTDLTNRPTLSTVATSGSYNDLTNRPSLVTTLGGLTDVTVTGVTSGQVLQYNGSGWVAGNVSAGGATSLSGLSDVSLVSVSSGQYLRYDGSKFINTNIAYSDVTGKPTLSTVATSGSYTDLSNKPTIPTSLNNLSDVAYIGAQAGHVLRYSGTVFNSTKLSYNDLNDTPTLSTVATSGSYTDLTNKPSIPTSISDLSDVSTSGIVSGQVLQWNGSSFVPATVSGGGGGASSLAELSDVNTTGAANGDVLTYDGSNWLPQALGSGGGTGGGAKIEWVKLYYTAGGLALGEVGTSQALEWSDGINNAIVLSNDSNGDLILEIEPNYNFPAATYMIYGYDANNNRYEMRPMTLKPSMQYLYPGVGHTTANPTTFGAFTKFRMSCTTSESGAATKMGLPAINPHAYIFMVYYK